MIPYTWDAFAGVMAYLQSEERECSSLCVAWKACDTKKEKKKRKKKKKRRKKRKCLPAHPEGASDQQHC